MNLNCFQLIKTVLDEEYSQIGGDEAEKDEKIRKALQRLRDHYANVTKNGAGDYSKRKTRFAYIYAYTTSHANLVYDLIRGNSTLAQLFDLESVQVSCIGGGPGSDFLGILKFLMAARKTPRVRCYLFDREQAWAESWTDVDAKIDPTFRLTVQFLSIDVTDPDTWKPHTKYFISDLFTMVYFCSEVSKLRSEAEEYFSTVFQRAKQGALFLFIDNNAPEHYGWFDKLAHKNGVRVTAHGEETRIVPFTEEKRDLGDYYSKFGDPKLKANIAWRIGVKQ